MWKMKRIAARTLIWLVAIAIPVQGLQAASCASNCNKCCSQDNEQSHCCGRSAEKRRDGRPCCALRRVSVSRSCCCKTQSGQDSRYKGGVNCQCGKTKEPKPATLPVDNNPAEKIGGESASTVFVTAVCQPQAPRRQNAASIELDALAALDRCSSLCRFTL